MEHKRITILGDGGWGTALAIHFSNKGKKVSLWSFSSEYASYLSRYRKNPKFLKSVTIPKDVNIGSDIVELTTRADIIIVAVPSQYLRDALSKLKDLKHLLKEKIFISATKGIERGSLLRMSEVLRQELKVKKLAVLSGPTIAIEVARSQPTTAVLAGKDEKLLSLMQNIFTSPSLRVYRNLDMIGTELGGALKNIIAISCGISDGLGYGSNTKAAILSRGLAEMKRLARAMGGKDATLNGISGLGDLVTTCVSKFSRNRFVGEQLAKGHQIRGVVSKMEMVAEGVNTVESAYSLSRKYNVEMPITREVYRVIYQGKSARKAVFDLMNRQLKAE